jgi:hypothetical protein
LAIIAQNEILEYIYTPPLKRRLIKISLDKIVYLLYTCIKNEKGENKMKYEITKKELRNKKATDFKEGDLIDVSIYRIIIIYGEYERPALKSRIFNRKQQRYCGCTPGVDRPYFLNDFLGR